MSGGYELGYEACKCFWGDEPGSLLEKYLKIVKSIDGINVLDVGSGEGKNAVWLAKNGARVVAVDLSQKAISNGFEKFGNVEGVRFVNSDIRSLLPMKEKFDLVVSYGFFHCLRDAKEISSILASLLDATSLGGYHIVCAFNDRNQDIELAHPGFNPTLIQHSQFLALYARCQMLYSSDEDLVEAHPNNRIKHTHSMTRLIAKKV